MSDTKVPIFRTALMSWRDGFTAFAAMPAVALGTFAAMLFSQITADAITIATTAEGFSWQWQLLRPALSLLYSYLAAPAGIAVSRYVLLGEAARRYDLDPSQPRLRQYFFYSAIIDLLSSGLAISVEAIGDEEQGTVDFLFALSAAVFLMLTVVLSIFMMILFPAIATDAPGANFRNAVRDTRFWRTVLTVLLILLPVLIAIAPSLWLYQSGQGFSLLWLALATYDSAITALTLAASAALGAHLYRAWGHRLNVSENLSPPSGER